MANEPKVPKGFAGLNDLTSDKTEPTSKPQTAVFPAAPNSSVSASTIGTRHSVTNAQVSHSSLPGTSPLPGTEPNAPVNRSRLSSIPGWVFLMGLLLLIFAATYFAQFSKASASKTETVKEVSTPSAQKSSARCVGSYEPEKCEALEAELRRESPQQAVVRRQALERERQKNLDVASGRLTPANPPVSFGKDDPIVQAPRPPTGHLKGDKQVYTGGLSSFKIDNTNGGDDAEVRLYLNERQVRSMFVRIGTSFTTEKLPPGTYKMRYKVSVDGRPRVFEAREEFLLSETRTEEGTRFSRMTVTLYKVKDGNMRTEEVPLDRF